MYSIDNIVTTSCCDEDGKLKLFSAFQMMQDCSELWVKSEPALDQSFKDMGMTQLLASREVEIVRVPKFGEHLTTITSIYDGNQLFGFRNTFIYDSNGQPCYKTWSTGAFVDRSSGKLKRIPEAVVKSVTIEPTKDMTYGERRIILPKSVELAKQNEVAVTHNDIDYNGHMNNANYIRIACEYLPDGFIYDHVRIEFKAPAKYGDRITPKTILTSEGKFFVQLNIDGRVSTIIEFK